jgi:hypothetical protein
VAKNGESWRKKGGKELQMEGIRYPTITRPVLLFKFSAKKSHLAKGVVIIVVSVLVLIVLASIIGSLRVNHDEAPRLFGDHLISGLCGNPGARVR